MLNIGQIDRIPNTTVYSLTETAPFIERVRLQQLGLLGHVPTHGRRKSGRQ